MFTSENLMAILGCTKVLADKWVGPLNDACTKFGIDTKLRAAAFIAQLGHESGRLAFVEENLNYSAQALLSVFKKYFDGPTATAYARQPAKIANRVYASRMGNGNEASGEGYKYRGRGLVQITGKDNYRRAGAALGVDLVSNPDLAATPAYAALTAGWFWSANNLNAKADKGDFDGITRTINGGLNGKDDRDALYKQALKSL